MEPKREKTSDVVRKAIIASGLSNYRICRAAGLNETVLSRFMGGTRGLTLATLDALADVLGLALVKVQPEKVLPPAKPGRKAKTKKRR
jgi:transcriptional regulator with XRE-family HTH domain